MRNTSQNTSVITSHMLRSWIRCKRKAWLDHYGDNSQRIWSAHRALQLDHQQKSIAALIKTEPGKGLEACKKGNEAILGLRLKGIGPNNESLQDHPTLLQRIQGTSCWGDFSYRPVIARQGKKILREHKLILTFTGILLEQFQGSDVSNGLVISKVRNELECQKVFLNKSIRKQLAESLIQLNDDINKSSPPSLISDRRKCSICCWQKVCNQEANQKGHLSEVSGIGSKRNDILNNLGLYSVEDLAKTDPSELSNKLKIYGEQHQKISAEIVAQAKVQFIGIEERINFKQSIPELIDSPGVLIYDIESDPDINDDFLHGFICIKKQNNNTNKWNVRSAKYHPILTLIEHGKYCHWKRVKSMLNHYKNWPIIHYGETENISALRLAKSAGSSMEEIDDLKGRFIDIHARLRENWRLPLKNYGLKTVAHWTGFRWSHKGAEGAKALFWWRQWRNSPQNSKRAKNTLQKLFKYNADDCLATWSVSQWLLSKDSIEIEPKS